MEEAKRSCDGQDDELCFLLRFGCHTHMHAYARGALWCLVEGGSVL